MRRLYLKIYLTIIASLVLVVVVAAGVWRWGAGGPPGAQVIEAAGEIVSLALPPSHAPQFEQQRALDDLARRFRIDLALFTRDGQPIAAAGQPLPPPPADADGDWIRGRGGPAWAFRLPDERRLVVRALPRHRHPAIHFLLALGGIALAVAVAAYPFVRGLTRRLERLQAGVEKLGAGNLAARVDVEGKDEVARLAQSFNHSAERIEDLMKAHRMLLANASHELRTPLSRIRLCIDLMQQNPDPKYKAAIEQDIAELDQMIDEILLASRLGTITAPQLEETVDLLALAAEEGARYDDCLVEGEPVTVRGDRRLLGRMIRNLLENARRHGAPPTNVAVRSAGGRAVIEVMDGGKGVPEAERERVFTPFYRLAGDTEGAGLGLALVQQIARLHGGDATVAPKPGHPSCFQVGLPKLAAANA
ncbi:MAG: HAMP domain-containing histidine kinase [Xanthobacteraceae bacterium]|nr:HAMP domain-containing histidine kinase [Xanthobacteraceae bacterium]